MMRLLLVALLALAQDAAVRAETNTTLIPEDTFTPEAGVVGTPLPAAERAVESMGSSQASADPFAPETPVASQPEEAPEATEDAAPASEAPLEPQSTEPWAAAPMAVESETTAPAPVEDNAVQAEAVEAAKGSADTSMAPQATEPAEPMPVATTTPSATEKDAKSFQETTASHSNSSSSSSSSGSSVGTQSSGSAGVTPTKAAVLLVLGALGAIVVLALLFLLRSRRRRRQEAEAMQLSTPPPTDASAPDLLASDADIGGLGVRSVREMAAWKTSGSGFASRDLPLGAATCHQRECSERSSMELALSLRPSRSPEAPAASPTALGFPGDLRATNASSDADFSVRSDSYSLAQGSTSSSIRSLDTARSDSSAWSQRRRSQVSSFVPRDVARTPSERETRAMASTSATAGTRDWYSVIESPADVHRASATSLDSDKRSDDSSFEL